MLVHPMVDERTTQYPSSGLHLKPRPVRLVVLASLLARIPLLVLQVKYVAAILARLLLTPI